MGFLHELPVWVEHKMHWEMPALSALHPKTGSPKLPHQTGEGLIFLLCLQFLIFFSLVCSSLPNIFFFFCGTGSSPAQSVPAGPTGEDLPYLRVP